MDKNDEMVIIDHWSGLDEAQRIELRNTIIWATGMSYSTFYNKMSGRTSFTRSEIKVIMPLLSQENHA